MKHLMLALAIVAPLHAQSGKTIVTPLPEGDIFAPLLADPKEPESLAGLARLESPIRNTTVGSAAFGSNIGLVRWRGAAGEQAFQVGLAGGVFAQFDLQRTSIDLLNADYLIGIPVTWRRGLLSVRLRVYHQSSHLGDEFLLDQDLQRVNLSFESAELIVSRAVGVVRIYGGGEYAFRHEPADLAAAMLHGGVEVRPRGGLFGLGRLGTARFVLGLDTKLRNDASWTAAWSVRTGLEFSGTARQRWSILLAAYDGPSPYGQFYTDPVRYVGAGVHFPL